MARDLGNFSTVRDITVSEGLPCCLARLRPKAMLQETMSAFVLKAGTLPQDAMNQTDEKHPSDERLMLEFAQGSADAFAELFRRYQQPIYGFFRRRVADAGRAEELAQETFLALLRGASRYEPRALFRTYLYAIGLRILRAERRKAAFRAAFLGRPAPSREPTAHHTADAGVWVRCTVENLDRIDREILLLREYEQLSYAEIADLLRIPVNTVRSRLFRARTALRELLEAPAPQPMPQKVAEVGEQP